jgi:hypothetical protein
MDIYYLYLKTHSTTGLKYLGKTTAKDPHKYKGSGSYWRNHLMVHGNNYTTTILKECRTKEELIKWGNYYSELWDIVDAKDNHGKKLWANLRPESGDGGSVKGQKKTESAKESYRNKVWSEKAIQSRLNNCLKNAAKRKGTKNPQHGEVIFKNYVTNNKEIILQIWSLSDLGYNRRQVSIQLGISWDRVNVAINKRAQILKELEN